MTARAKRGGFTLIETLAVAVIAALVAGLVVSVPWGRVQVDDEGPHRVQMLEDRLREAARDGQGLSLRHTREGWIAIDGQGRRHADLETELPMGGRWRDRAGRPLTAFAYDRRGFSIDARLRVISDGKQRWVALDGITGEVRP